MRSCRTKTLDTTLAYHPALPDGLVVAPQKESQADLVHHHRFRKRQGLANEAGEPLPQRVIETLDMTGLAALLADCAVLPRWYDALIRLPEVAIHSSSPILRRDGLPQLPAGHFIPRADRIADYLACLAAKC